MRIGGSSGLGGPGCGIGGNGSGFGVGSSGAGAVMIDEIDGRSRIELCTIRAQRSRTKLRATISMATAGTRTSPTNPLFA